MNTAMQFQARDRAPFFEPITKTWERSRNLLMTLIVIVFAQVFGFAVACHNTADPTPRDPAVVQHEQEIKAEASYLGELMACTAKSPSLAESKLCEEIVDEKWRVKNGWATSAPAPAAKDGGQ